MLNVGIANAQPKCVSPLSATSKILSKQFTNLCQKNEALNVLVCIVEKIPLSFVLFCKLNMTLKVSRVCYEEFYSNYGNTHVYYFFFINMLYTLHRIRCTSEHSNIKRGNISVQSNDIQLYYGVKILTIRYNLILNELPSRRLMMHHL